MKITLIISIKVESIESNGVPAALIIKSKYGTNPREDAGEFGCTPSTLYPETGRDDLWTDDNELGSDDAVVWELPIFKF